MNKMGLRRSEMKKAKWVVAFLALALVAGLVAGVVVGCGDGGEATTTSESGPTTTDNGQNYTFVFSLGMPVMASLYNTYVIPWTEAVAGGSNGRITFSMKPNNSLVKESQQMEACRSGLSDIVAFQSDWNRGVYPLLELATMPALFGNTEVAARVMLEIIAEYGQEEYADFHVLGFMAISPNQWGGKAPVRLPADFSGLRVRSGGGVETDIINALGGVPTESATGNLQTDLSRNRFDGLFLSWSFHAGNTNEWATDWTAVNLFMRPILLVMNGDKWDSLPAAVQQMFTDNSTVDQIVQYLNADALYQYQNAGGDDFTAVQARAESLGTEIVVLTAEEKAQWATAMEPVLQKWVTDYASVLPTAEILARAKELALQYNATSTQPDPAAAAIAGETTTTATE
jgi:TRAP-type C4-dicarboxylate transport system substrate-binding protein